jgi:hypothetical protein
MTDAQESGSPAAIAAVSDRVEDALRHLLAAEVAELTEKGKGGRKCWAAVLLTIAKRQPQSTATHKHPIARLIADVLDPTHAIADERRNEVARFCRKIVDQAAGIGLGRLHRLSRAASPFAAAVLAPFGEENCRPFGQAGGRHLSIEQLLARLDPHQPYEVQATAVKVLPDIVGRDLRASLQASQNRQSQLATLKQAVGMVEGTKYFESLAPKMRQVCEDRMTELRNRIDRAGRRP